MPRARVLLALAPWLAACDTGSRLPLIDVSYEVTPQAAGAAQAQVAYVHPERGLVNVGVVSLPWRLELGNVEPGLVYVEACSARPFVLHAMAKDGTVEVGGVVPYAAGDCGTWGRLRHCTTKACTDSWSRIVGTRWQRRPDPLP